MVKERVGLYPGTFDPITDGHVDIISRATGLVDRLIVGVAVNRDKGPLFTVEERAEMVQEEISLLNDLNGAVVEVKPLDGLLMHFAEAQGASIIIRGLRAVSDFEYEFQMVGMNARLNPNVETVFLMSRDKYQFIASKLVKEIARLSGDVSKFVSPRVETRLVQRFKHGK